MLPPGAMIVSSLMESAGEGTEIMFTICPGGGLLNATCTTGGWVPSLPQPPYECNDPTTAVTTDAQFVTTSEKSYTATTRKCCTMYMHESMYLPITLTCGFAGES